MLAQDHILSPALLSIGLNMMRPVPKARATAATTPKGRSETQKNPMKKTRKYVSFEDSPQFSCRIKKRVKTILSLVNDELQGYWL
jgi:hypothetical protein